METISVETVNTGKVGTDYRVNQKALDDFIAFPKRLYADCAQYVPDLDADVRAVFNPRKNSAFAFTDLQGFVAYRDGRPVGRVLAIINRHANEKWNTKAVRFGYLDFIDDQEVSRTLLDTIAKWGLERGMDNMQGPLGITDYDKEGMLVSDFDMLASMATYYNYAYYPQHMDQLGFHKLVDWVSTRFKVPEKTPAKYARAAQLVPEMFGVHTRELTKKEIRAGYIYKIFDLFNASFSPLFGFTAFSHEQAREFMNMYLPLLGPEMFPVVENDKGELVAIAVTLGGLSHAMRKTGGRLWPFGWYHILKALRWKREDTAELLLIAVRPDMQGLGMTALLFDHLVHTFNKYGFKWAETGPQLENNNNELSQWRYLNPTFVKRRRCYGKDINQKA